MNFVSADFYVPVNLGAFSGGKFVSGPHSGRTLDMGFLIIFPNTGSPNSLSSTLYFSQSPKRFLNLGNVTHLKASGNFIATQASCTEYDTLSVFGPMYLMSRVYGFQQIVFQQQSATLSGKFFGNYNNSKEGYWYAASGIRWMGNACIFISCANDLDGYRTKGYGSIYQITAFERRLDGNTLYCKDWSTSTWMHASDYTVDQVFDQYAAQVKVNLDALAWSRSPSWYSKIIGSNSDLRVPNFSSISVDNLFTKDARNSNWSELARRAYNSVSLFQGNGVALTGDLVGLKAAAVETGALVSKLLGAGASLQVIAKVFLAFHYGWKLLISDLRGLSSAMDKYSKLTKFYSKCSATETWDDGNRTYKNIYSCYYIRDGQVQTELARLTGMFDFDLSLTNIWDLVPLSFVVDWFTQLSTSCESLDSYYKMTQRHTVICSGRSIKCLLRCTSAQAGFHGWAGAFTLSYYEREYRKQIIYPSLLLDTTIQPLQHIVEGGALIVSRR